jgi:hypothetical protein
VGLTTVKLLSENAIFAAARDGPLIIVKAQSVVAMRKSNQHLWDRPRVPLPICRLSQKDRVMLITVCRLYNSYTEEAGVPPSETSVISNNSDAWYAPARDANVIPSRKGGAGSHADGKVEGAAIGAAIGATAATAASLVTMLALPGVGAIVGAGWLAV